jgi:predicted ATPase
MLVTRLKLKNWRNFREMDLNLDTRAYVIGANASGKSNLLDVFRFLRTVAKPAGGGLQAALRERLGMTQLRSLHARQNPEVSVWVEMKDSESNLWTYEIAFKSEGKGKQRVLVSRECASRNGEKLLLRPDAADKKDAERLTQTALEQINQNVQFRVLADFFADTTYLHLVPQLLKFSNEISGRIVENDPFGQGLLQRIARESAKTRDARLRRISEALKVAVPQFFQLRFVKDEATGTPHLEANFQHWRGNDIWQREEQFSDGTLRLIGLLWALQEGDGLLLLEEPELSLNDAIVEHIPLVIDRVLRLRKKGARQVIITTYSDNLIAKISDPSVSVILLEPGENGTLARKANTEESLAMENGLNPAEVLLPKTRPQRIEHMGLF